MPLEADLSTLDPTFAKKVNLLLDKCEDAGVVMVPFFTVRSPWEQAKLWRKTRTSTEVKAAIQKFRNAGANFLADCIEDVGPQQNDSQRGHVTNALPGLSWHQWGLAVDCFWSVNDKAEWNKLEGYKKYRTIAQQIGLYQGPAWDWVHVQGVPYSSPQSKQTGYTLKDIDKIMKEKFDK